MVSTGSPVKLRSPDHKDEKPFGQKLPERLFVVMKSLPCSSFYRARGAGVVTVLHCRRCIGR